MDRWNDPAACARHLPEFYDQQTEPVRLTPGQQLLVPCAGGPCLSRLEVYPPRLEIPEPGGIYVLVDEGRRDEWRYEFVPHAP